MKKIVIAILAMGLLVGGLLWTIRRSPGAVPLAEDDPTMFRLEPAAGGSLIRYDAPQTPLRFLRFVRPRQVGLLVAQVVTQSDRQRISLFKAGAFHGTYIVPRPAGVREGFFRLAELRDAWVVEGEVALLLYATPGTEEPALLVALDLATNAIRWSHRAPGEQLVMAEGPEAVVYLFGTGTPPIRLPLALASKETLSPTGTRSSARTIELPPEVLEIADLKPTGSWTFLLAHKGGLSAYLGSKGWVHQPLPEGDPGLFKAIKPALGSGGRTYWWQPFPGRVLQVLADGTPKALWTPETLPVAEPFGRDAALLHLLGVDAAGQLWFDLSGPVEPPAVPLATEWQPETPAEAPVTPVEPDWPAYVSQGLDRIYRWDPKKKVLQRAGWASLNVPQGFARPKDGLPLQPAAGALLLETGSSAWLAPLSLLAFGEPAKTGNPVKPGS